MPSCERLSKAVGQVRTYIEKGVQRFEKQSVIGTVGTRIVWIFLIFPQYRSLYTLFISYPASWAITIVMQVICFVFVRRKVHGQLKGTAKAREM